MKQYVEQKQRVGDAVLLFRMGDFYETFYDDAILCSKVLGIALTTRDKNSEKPVPLAGIPYHALEPYLKRLVAAGHKVAISEQLEDPKQAKGVVRRDVVRIVTSGTLTDDALLNEKDENTLAALCLREKGAGLAIVELAGGRFEILDVSPENLVDTLVRERPAELLIDDERGGSAESLAQQLRSMIPVHVSRRPAHELSPYQAERTLLDHFQVATLAGFGFEEFTPGLSAAGCILQYLKETQQTALRHITAIRRRVVADFVQIDHGTWRSLEIDRTLRHGAVEGSLLWAIDRTVHPIGSRTLRRWLRAPLIDRAAIIERQDAIAAFLDASARAKVRRQLKTLADVERIAGRIALARCSPRDLAALSRSLSALPMLREAITDQTASFLRNAAVDLTGLEDVAGLLSRALLDEPPLSPREGGIIRDGHLAELDRLRAIGSNGRQWLADYQRREIESTGINNLKVGFNRVFGYYIEISHAARGEVPVHYVRKQTIKNAERYITEELKNYETEVLTAQERANELEFRLFEQLRERAAARMTDLLRVADAIGRLDCVFALAELTEQRRYVRPHMVADGRIDILDGRHPVLDQTLGDAFVPNDCLMNSDDARVFVITGPNMAGKSTYIRQVALLTLLAQTGSFVPAREMSFSLADRVFARVGSADEIARGQSTFMVEMTEAANILHNATDRSLVVLDELGRGTSTFDGLSLAWAITEHLANQIGCRSLIATHYHELIELANMLRGVRNYNVAVRELPPTAAGDEGLAFLHKIVEGGASKSYGVHVARLAGIPKTVIERSREVMDELQRGFERESRTPQLLKSRTKTDDQMLLFRDPAEELLDALRAALRTVDPDQTTPISALQMLKEWKDRFSA